MKKRLIYYWRRFLVAFMGREIRCRKTGKRLGKMYAYVDSEGCVVVMGMECRSVYVDFETPNSLGFTLVNHDACNENRPHSHLAS